MNAVPANPKIYHIVHMDRLASIIADGHLWCDAEIERRKPPGTSIGMNNIKHRRLYELMLDSHPGLHVGDCVPFYFCPRSVMLFLIHKRNHELDYKDGQQPIIHLESDLYSVVNWANSNGRRWAFTLSNAGSRFFEDRSDLSRLNEVEWSAVGATNWQGQKEGKQAEFLLENNFPWHLIERIGVINANVYTQVKHILSGAVHIPVVDVKRDWYY